MREKGRREATTDEGPHPALLRRATLPLEGRGTRAYFVSRVRIGLRRRIIRRNRSRQRAEKGDNVGRVLLRQILPELRLAHDFHGFRQVLDRPVVKIGRCLRDIAKARDLEDIKVRVILCDVRATLVRRRDSCRLPVVAHDAKFLEGIAADARAIVARGAAQIDEFAQPGLLLASSAPRRRPQGRRRIWRASAACARRRRPRRPNSSN